MRLFILFLLTPFFLLSQTQIGNDIDGILAGDNAGHSVSISANGSIVAIGSPGNDEAGKDAGHVRVFQNNDGVWTQIGNSINGAATEDKFGTNVSISADGSVVAISAPKYYNGEVTVAGLVGVYQNISGSWTQIGNDIDGEYGLYVSLSSDGISLAISDFDGYGLQHGTPSEGKTRIYENSNGNWTQLGEEISTGWPGISNVELSADGSTVAIASSVRIWGTIGDYIGGAKVFKNVSGVWTQIGEPILADLGWFSFFIGISLSNNGSKIAIGGHWYMRIYENIDEEWIQQGGDIESEYYESEYYWNGLKPSLSDDGTILAIGGSITRIYENSSGNWIQIGVDLTDETEDDVFRSIEISNDGTTLIVGSPNIEGNGIDAGHARVYNLSALLSVEESSMLNVKLYPNPTTNQFTLELPLGQTLEKVNIYNNLGQFIQTSNQNIINTSKLSSGLYYVEIVTNLRKATKKLVIK